MGLDSTLYQSTNRASGEFQSGIGASATTINLKAGEGAEFPQPIIGSATSGGDINTLNSTGIQAAGVVAGDFIKNITDDSQAFVVSVDTNSIETTNLEGGSGNTWDNSDEWRVNEFIISANTKDSDGVITAIELIRIEDRSTDILTVATGGRGFGNTAAQIWNADDAIELFDISEHNTEMIKMLSNHAVALKALQDTAPSALEKASLPRLTGFDLVSTGASLNVTIDAGIYNSDGDTSSSTPLTLTGSMTNFIEVDSGTGVVSFNTTGFTTGLISLWEAVTDGSGVTSETDKRQLFGDVEGTADAADVFIATAGETISARRAVCKNSTADEIINLFLEGQGANDVFDSGSVIECSAAFVTADTVAVSYGTPGAVLLVAGILSGKTITWGTPQTITGASDRHDIAQIADGKIAVVYRGSGADVRVVVATVSGTVFTIGSSVQVDSANNNFASICKIDTDKFLVAYYDSDNTQGEAAAATVSGTVPTVGTPVVFETNVIAGISCCQVDTDKALVIWQDATDTDGEGRIASISGTVVTFPSAAVDWNASTTNNALSCVQLTTDKAVITWNDSSVQNAKVCSVSGTTPSYGAEATISTAVTVDSTLQQPRSCAAISSTIVAIAYSDSSTSYYSIVDISGTTLTSRGTTDSGNGDGDQFGVAALDDSDRFVVSFDDDDNTSDGTGFVVSVLGNGKKFVGVSVNAIADAATGTIRRFGRMTGFSGLTIGANLYWNESGLTETVTTVPAGVAFDTDELEAFAPRFT